MLYFNPRSLAGATFIFWRIVLQIIISIHAPSRERLTTCLMCSIPQNEFQSTLPRGSDIRNENHSAFVVISIHAPSRERPSTSALPSPVKLHFNPRSLAGATRAAGRRKQAAYISIHAPSRERRAVAISAMPARRFQSTLPRGSDDAVIEVNDVAFLFQSTLPRGSDFIRRGI